MQERFCTLLGKTPGVIAMRDNWALVMHRLDAEDWAMISPNRRTSKSLYTHWLPWANLLGHSDFEEVSYLLVLERTDERGAHQRIGYMHA